MQALVLINNSDNSSTETKVCVYQGVTYFVNAEESTGRNVLPSDHPSVSIRNPKRYL